jgi:uncharacterized membrane protein YhdT
MIIFVFIRRIYKYVILIFINCLCIFTAITVIESIVKPMETHTNYTFRGLDRYFEASQLRFLDLYFIVYTYAMVGLIFSSLFILATEIMIRW